MKSVKIETRDSPPMTNAHASEIRKPPVRDEAVGRLKMSRASAIGTVGVTACFFIVALLVVVAAISR